jgi:hypothetical protein
MIEWVQTTTGTIYLINYEASTFTRKAGPGRFDALHEPTPYKQIHVGERITIIYEDGRVYRSQDVVRRMKCVP